MRRTGTPRRGRLEGRLRSLLFSSGGALSLSEKFKVPFLGAIPLDSRVCESGELGRPIVVADPDGPAGSALRHVARQVAAQVSLQNHNRKTLTIDLATKT